jgi:hypothetical protein
VTGKAPLLRYPACCSRSAQVRHRMLMYIGSLQTCRPSMSSANLPANTGTCRQRSPLSAADLLDTAVINLPVHSQTDISVKLIKQWWMAGRTCVTYVNSLSPVRGNVSVQYPVPAPPPVRARLPAPARSREGVRPGEGRRARRPAAARAGAGKAAGGGGKARGRTVINSGAVSDGMRGNWRGNCLFRGGKALTASEKAR